MRSSEVSVPHGRARLGLRLALAWFILVNIAFYWNLFRDRAAEVAALWRQLIALIS